MFGVDANTLYNYSFAAMSDANLATGNTLPDASAESPSLRTKSMA